VRMSGEKENHDKEGGGRDSCLPVRWSKRNKDFQNISPPEGDCIDIAGIKKEGKGNAGDLFDREFSERKKATILGS